MKKEPLTVLVTGSDAPGFSSIIRSLKLSMKYDFKIIGTDWKENLKAKYYSDKAFKLPDNKSDMFITELLKTCKNEQVDVILLIRTDDQVVICEYLADFEDIGTIPAVITPDPKIMDIALNKGKMLKYIQEVSKLPTMDYSLVSNIDELHKALEKLGYPNNPIAIKPAHATGSRGFRIIDPAKDLKDIFFEEKPTSTYTTLEDVTKILGDEFPEMPVMEYLEEPEYTLDVLCYKGKTFAIVPRKRLKMIGGITQNGIVEQLNDQTNDYIEKLIESFGFSYSVGVQIRKSAFKKDLYHVIEINPRLQGTTIISVAAGINIPEKIIDMALKKFDFDFQPKIRYGLKMERTFFELFEFENKTYNLEEINELDKID